MDKVRFGIVGVGGMGSGHANTIQNIEECELVAVCDIDPEVVKQISEKHNVKSFTDYKELIDSGMADAVIVATPHYYHPIVGMYAMDKGLAVLSEKPMAVTVKSADAMIEKVKETGVPFTIMYQSRASGVNQAARKLIAEGKLGEIYRTCLISSGFRSQAYYNSAPWRGTWKEEGGGVLINQAPHPLDLFSWIGGLPSKVTARTANRRHEMECEDEASAMLEYENGAIGFLHVSTSESPGTSLMEFCGEKGKLTIRGGSLDFRVLEMPLQEFNDTTENMWGSPKCEKVEVEIEDRETGHGAIIRNLARNILHGEPLIVPGEEGVNSMELINSVILSGHKGEPVDVPLDRDEYERFIEEMKKTSKVDKSAKVQRVTDPNHVK
ncbi:gfo/Idh/MocA family oxidoreductase [Candidatus Poribacteria bacterium]|nr:gfo/Idh/MocA family oxidoreductase [Candidatus Poribacteria bacterium]